jgi:hypothetical protein
MHAKTALATQIKPPSIFGRTLPYGLMALIIAVEMSWIALLGYGLVWRIMPD